MKRPAPPNQPRLWTRRSMLLALAGTGLTVPACEFGQLFSWNGGNPVLFGYSSAPRFDRHYKTIRVNIFKNPTFWSAVPVPGLEMELAEILVQQIGQKTPYKVNAGDPDMELSGMILSFIQIGVNYTQLNEVRQVETIMTCAVQLKDVRTGQLLSSPRPNITEPPPPAGLLPGQQDPLNQASTLPGSLQTMELSAAPVSPGGNPATLAQTSPPPSTAGNPVPGQTNVLGPPGGAPAVAPGMMPIMGVLVRSIAYYAPEIGQSLATAQQDNCTSMALQIIDMMEVGW
ncbi:MAG TPA: LPS assembly lipoprotein LptE [Gemmataceae bacterium]|nr:LPS assembly lipoprotein LptE [Gemmataceae bacterium]